MSELRQRQVTKKKSTANTKSEKASVDESAFSTVGEKSAAKSDKFKLAFTAITVLAFASRFYIINYPNEVV